ncbi:hypothetical protein EHI48_28595 [Rhizobium sp. WSM1325]|nr:hypothetical protein [Rhizobium leguminosarum]RWY68801.1 hypothetical protein EHI48_28595 [Rhizobium leguminosarum]
MSDGRFQLWIGLCLLGGFCAYSWYWYIRSIIFYFRNGFDFSEDFGPEMSEFPDDDRFTTKPREKFLVAWPVFVLVTSLLLLFIVLGLMGVLKPCHACGP